MNWASLHDDQWARILCFLIGTDGINAWNATKCSLFVEKIFLMCRNVAQWMM